MRILKTLLKMVDFNMGVYVIKKTLSIKNITELLFIK